MGANTGGEFVITMPAFSGFICTSDALSMPCTGLSDFGLLKNNNQTKRDL